MSIIQEGFGFANASESLDQIHQAGVRTMDALLKEVESPFQEKQMRTWGITEASEMVGRTPQYIRQQEKANKIPLTEQRIAGSKRAYSLADVNKMRDLFKTRFKRPLGSKPMILAVSNFKGGCAKTTTAIHLAQKSALEGLRVLLIDLDPQATSTLLMDIIPDIHLEYEDTIAETLIKNPTQITSIIRKTYFDGLDIIPSNLSVQDVEFALPNHEINNSSTLGSPLTRLSNSLSIIQSNYDVIVMDCGPNTGALTVNAISACNGILVPIPPAMENFGSFVTFASSLSMLCEAVKKELLFFKLLITRVTNSIESQMITSMIRQHLPGLALENHMVSTVEIEKASSQLSTVYEIAKPINNAKAYHRAIESMNGINSEVLSIFKQIWAKQSKEVQNG